MNPLNYVRNISLIFFGNAFVLLVLAWMLFNNCLSGLEFAVIVFSGFFAEIFLFYRLIRSRQRSSEELRKKQIASGISADALDRDRYLRNIRGAKWLIAAISLFLLYDLLSTQGDPLLPRSIFATIDFLILAIGVYYLMRSRKRLKELPADRPPDPSNKD